MCDRLWGDYFFIPSEKVWKRVADPQVFFLLHFPYGGYILFSMGWLLLNFACCGSHVFLTRSDVRHD